jgi:hypothetical protein
MRWKMLVPACLIASISALLPENLSAQEYGGHAGALEISGWAGYGLVDVNANNSAASSRSAFALGFRGGYAITSRVAVGLELSGWTINAYDFNNPSHGESISNVSAYMDYSPFNDLPLYFTWGGGQTSYVNNDPLVAGGRDSGGSWFLGSGYEYPLAEKLMLVPQIRYSRGSFSSGDFHAYEMALGLKWYVR